MSREEGGFGLACCLDSVARTGEEGLTGGGGAGIGGGAMVGAGARLVMSWVSCCNWAIRPTKIVLIACSEAF